MPKDGREPQIANLVRNAKDNDSVAAINSRRGCMINSIGESTSSGGKQRVRLYLNDVYAIPWFNTINRPKYVREF